MDPDEGASQEDSEDFTEEEVTLAIPTANHDELVRHLKEELANGHPLKRHEIRRRGGHLFWRARFEMATSESDLVLVFRVDWLNGG